MIIHPLTHFSQTATVFTSSLLCYSTNMSRKNEKREEEKKSVCEEHLEEPTLLYGWIDAPSRQILKFQRRQVASSFVL